MGVNLSHSFSGTTPEVITDKRKSRNTVAQLRAEIDRLREGLERIINVSRFTGNWDTAVAIASEALEGK